jgi:PA14 domain
MYAFMFNRSLRSLRFVRSVALCGTLAAGILASAGRAHATWYSENIRDGSDIIMMDLRWPWWPCATYYANWNSGFNPKPNNLSFYAGFVSTMPDGPGFKPSTDARLEAAFRPGTVWSFWGSSADGTPVRFIDTAPNLYMRNVYGGEGLSGTLGAEPWNFVHSQQWYRMLGRVWPARDGSHTSIVARWIKDLSTNRWHLIAAARLPIEATSFVGNSGFIEPLTSEKAVRSLHRRLGYARKDGHWYSSNTISIDKTEYVVVNTVPEGNHEYAAIEYSQRPDLMPLRLTGHPLAGDKKYDFTVRQPEAPVLDKPAITAVHAESAGASAVVSWQPTDTSSPIIGFRAELFATRECIGKPLSTAKEHLPGITRASLKIAGKTGWVRITALDVFDQKTTPITVAVTPAAGSPALPAPAGLRSGLAYTTFIKQNLTRRSYFNSPLHNPDEQHRWLTLAELKTGTLERQGIARGFDLSILEARTAGVAIRFNGFLRVPASGEWLFHARIDGAYRLKIDGQPVLTYDGQHGSTRKIGAAPLLAGLHSIELEYLYDELPAQNFILEWEGPGTARQQIGAESLFMRSAGAPQAAITAAEAGGGAADVRVKTQTNGHTIRQIALYLGALQLARGGEGTGELVYSGPLHSGQNTLWARVIYDKNHTVDTRVETLNLNAPTISAGWEAHNVGDQKAPHSLMQSGTDSFQFFGSGMHTVTRQITGDFTAICKVDAYNGSKGEPVNRRAWVGLTARERAAGMNWEWGTDFHLVQTAADGLRCSPDNSDLGAERIASYELPKGHPWLKIERRGNSFTAWTSADGEKWVLGGYQYRRAQPQMAVGLFFSALPQEARAHYSAAVSHVSVVQNAPGGSLPAATAVTDGRTVGDRFTGVVVSRSNPEVIMLRSSGMGAYRSEDGGKTWHPVNGSAGSYVRSLAIHPTNPNIVLRAEGDGKKSALLKSEDGGKTYNALNFPGDFDGKGPSALCGEVIAFDLRNPEIIYAGTESKGVFRSTDSGKNWAKMGAEGERVTSITVWPWERYYPASARGKTQIGITTCPDSYMALLGRGEPAVKTAQKASRGYSTPDGGITLSLLDERPDTGFYNVAFDKATQNVYEFSYATSHGVQTNSGGHMSLFPPQKSLDWMTPVTAVGASAHGEEKFGRFLSLSLLPTDISQLSLSVQWAFEWSRLKTSGGPSAGGLIATAPNLIQGETWWFVFTEGIYRSTDGGKHLQPVNVMGGHLPD